MGNDRSDDLRMMLRARIASQDGSIANAGRAMGISDVMIHTFFAGRPLSIEMCLRLAKYLDIPAQDVLRMAGREDVALLLDGDPASSTVSPDPHTSALAQVLAGLDPDEKLLALDAVSSIAEGLRKNKKKRLYHARSTRTKRTD